MKVRTLFATAAVLVTAFAHAQDVQVSDSFARATVPQQKTAGAYVTIENKGKETDRLIGATTPVAKSVEIHTMELDGNVMRMREAGPIELKPASRVEMHPGEGYHLMMAGLRQPLKAGDSFPLTLQFEKAGKIEVAVPVQAGRGAHQGHGKH